MYEAYDANMSFGLTTRSIIDNTAVVMNSVMAEFVLIERHIALFYGNYSDVGGSTVERFLPSASFVPIDYFGMEFA